jgi:segregation and condensation protein A
LPALDDLIMDDMPPDDPLVVKLKEYRRVKEAAQRLGEKEKEALSSFPRPGHARVEESKDLSEVSLVDLLDALRSLLSTEVREATVLRMHRVPLSVPQRMQQIWHRVELGGPPVAFIDLLAEDATKPDIIVSFLAILELARMRRIELRQSGARGVIEVRRHPEASGPLILSEGAGFEDDNLEDIAEKVEDA